MPLVLSMQFFLSNFLQDFKSNLHTLYGVKRIPSITRMRSIVDKISPQSFYFIFKKLFNVVQRGGRLKDFELMRISGNPYYLMPTDGSEYYSSHKIKCKHCMVKRHKKREIMAQDRKRTRILRVWKPIIIKF